MTGDFSGLGAGGPKFIFGGAGLDGGDEGEDGVCGADLLVREARAAFVPEGFEEVFGEGDLGGVEGHGGVCGDEIDRGDRIDGLGDAAGEAGAEGGGDEVGDDGGAGGALEEGDGVEAGEGVGIALDEFGGDVGGFEADLATRGFAADGEGVGGHGDGIDGVGKVRHRAG